MVCAESVKRNVTFIHSLFKQGCWQMLNLCFQLIQSLDSESKTKYTRVYFGSTWLSVFALIRWCGWFKYLHGIKCFGQFHQF